MIFDRVAHQKKMIKIRRDDKDEKGVWMTCADNVYNWCKNNFKTGDLVNVVYTESNGQYDATKVTAVETPAQAQPKETVPTPQPKAIPPLTQTKVVEIPKNKEMTYPYEYMKPKTPEESAQMRACSILSSVSQAITSLTAQIDANTLGEMLETLYDRFDKKLPK